MQQAGVIPSYFLKILILGNSGCGKSSLLLRYVDDAFTDEFVSTVGVDFREKIIQKNDEKIRLQIWDTAGQDRYKSITSVYCRGASAVILTYDVTDPKSYEHLTKWLSYVESHCLPEIPKLLIGTKTDLNERRIIPYETAKAFADEHKMDYVELSSKSGYGVHQAFEVLINRTIQHILAKNLPRIPERKKIKVTNNVKKEDLCCTIL